MRKILLSLVLLFAAISSALAQKFTVESFKIAPSDLTAQTQPRKDLNNRNCALIKVGLGLKGVQFEGNIIGNVENKTGEYWVYMPQGNSMLKVKHYDYAPVMVNFVDFGVNKLESNRTYEMTVVTIPPTTSNNTISIPVKDGISIEMVRVEAGTFTMGATPEMKTLSDSSKPAHQVTLTNDYYLGKYEVTQALWQAVMGNNPSEFKGRDLPVENVSWYDCQTFISKLNAMTGRKFRMPTEAEWEFAARGGNKSRGYLYSGSNTLSDVAWYNDNSGGKTHTVGTKQPNELGIYDMSGNVCEWCHDWDYEYNNSPQVNPIGATDGSYRLNRGGCWDTYVNYCPLFFRSRFVPRLDFNFLGLRLALSE